MAYNGWTNYETWNVALWLDNDPGTEHDCRDMARHAHSEHDLANALESYVDDMTPDLGASMFSDLLGAALHEVDWDEIAGHYYDEAHAHDNDDEADTDDETSEVEA